MSIFDTLYGFNPNTIQQPNYYVPPNRTTANPPTINPIGTYTDLIAVHGIEGAKQHSMRPNSRVALFDVNDDIMYIKQTDSNNYPSIKIYRFTEIIDEPVEQPHKYVTIEEFNKLKEELLNEQQSIRESTATASPTKSTAKRVGTVKKSNADV